MDALLSISLLWAGTLQQLRVIVPDTPNVRFETYAAASATPGKLAMPQIKNAEEHRFEKVLRNAIAHGWGVVDGGTEHERQGANFGGHYVLVQWGCGSDCTQAALIDGRDGRVLKLPHVREDHEPGYQVGTGSADPRTLEFRWNSLLIGIPQRADGKTYYYRLDGKRWQFVKKQVTSPQHD